MLHNHLYPSWLASNQWPARCTCTDLHQTLRHLWAQHWPKEYKRKDTRGSNVKKSYRKKENRTRERTKAMHASLPTNQNLHISCNTHMQMQSIPPIVWNLRERVKGRPKSPDLSNHKLPRHKIILHPPSSFCHVASYSHRWKEKWAKRGSKLSSFHSAKEARKL